MSLQRGRGFVPNYVEFGKHVRSEAARAPAVLFAEKVAAFANATAPVQVGDAARKKESKERKAKDPVKGGYRVIPRGNATFKGSVRAIAVVVNTTSNAVAGEITQKPGAKNPRTLFKAAVAVSIAEFGSFDGYGKSGRLGRDD